MGYKNANDIANFMNTITISLSSIENQLLEYNSRLNSIETSLCNVYDVAALPPVTQNPSTLDTSPIFPINCEVELPTRGNVSLHTEDDFNPQNEIHTPPNYRRTTFSGSTTSISPLVFRLPSETTRSLKKVHTEAKDRNQYLRSGMDQLFTQEEMAQSNFDGKRNKRKLDGTRVDLLQSKLKLLRCFVTVLGILMLL